MTHQNDNRDPLLGRDQQFGNRSNQYIGQPYSQALAVLRFVIDYVFHVYSHIIIVVLDYCNGINKSRHL